MTDLLSLVNFDEYTFTDVQIKIVIAVIAFIFVMSGITAVVSFPKDKRKMAWIISLVNASVLSFAASTYMFVKWSSIVSDIRGAFHSVDNVSAVIGIWLCQACFWDLAFGVVFYPKYLDLLSAWLHHVLYIWIMIVAVSGNGGFAKFEAFAGGGAFLLIEEIPTFLLALGSVFPSLRTDLGFGISFLLLRLGYHATIFVVGIKTGISPLVLGLFSITMVMHLFWFYSWFTKYGKKLLGGKGGEKVKVEAKQL